MSLDWNWSDVLLMIRLGLGVWGRETTEIKCHFHHLTARLHALATQLITADVDPDHLGEAHLSGYSTVKLLFFFFFTSFL